MTLQSEIDAIEYPPSHTYQLNGLVPGEILAKRMAVITKEFPKFFKDGTLLDVGCNKGFFSLYHRGEVVGIDTNEKCVEICRRLHHSIWDAMKGDHKEYYTKSFGEFESDRKFSRVFIGNGHHYPFIEAGGWSFIEKLGNLVVTGGFVLLEGPTGMESVDAQNCIPEELASEFTQEKLIEAFDSLFILRKIVPSSLSDRYFLLFEKRDAKDIFEKYLRSVYDIAKFYTASDSSDVIMEICTRHDRGILGREILPHKDYIMVDKASDRVGLSLDAVEDVLPECDVLVSTAIFHHTTPENIEKLFNNLARNTRRTIIITGPADDTGVPLYGDHLYHLNRGEIVSIARRNGWDVEHEERIGLKHCIPYEYLFVFSRKSSS